MNVLVDAWARTVSNFLEVTAYPDLVLHRKGLLGARPLKQVALVSLRTLVGIIDRGKPSAPGKDSRNS
jgi:hypothetical protein